MECSYYKSQSVVDYVQVITVFVYGKHK